MAESVLSPTLLKQDSRWLLRTLFWKEFRELGYYAACIVLFGLGFLLITISIDFEKTFGLKVGPGQASIANVLPLLVMLAGAAAAFSIEHENRSFNLLRSLPISPGNFLITKTMTILVLAVVSCVICWPFAYYLILKEGPDKANFVNGLFASSISMIEALLWSIFFSMRERQVVRAMIKACVGLILVSNGFAVLSWMDMGSYDMDGVYFWLKVVGRIGVAIYLVVAIGRQLTNWCCDPDLANESTSARVRSIEAVRTSTWSPYYRLIWMQIRSTWIPLVAVATFSLWVAYTGCFHPHQFVKADGLAQLYWSLSLSLVGSLSLAGLTQSNRMMVAIGFRPVQIWLTHTALPLVFCISTALLFRYWYGVGNYSTGYFLTIAFTAFFAGQLAGFIWGAPIMAMFLAIAVGFVSYGCYVISAAAFPSMIPTFILLTMLPILLIALFCKTKVVEGRLSRKFWMALPIGFLIFASPMPLMRIYEVPETKLEAIKARFPKAQKYPEELLAELRTIADQLRDLYDPKTQDSQLQELSLTAGANRKTEDLVKIRSHELATWAISSNGSMEMLLNNDQDNPRDLYRAIIIRNAVNGLINDAVYAKHRNRNPDDMEIDFAVVNRAIAEFDRWGYAAPGPTVLHWWMTRQQVTRQDLRNLVQKLEALDPFDRYRIYENARLRFSNAALDLDPRVYPDQMYFYPRDRFWYTFFLRAAPWEVARYKRAQRLGIEQALDQIDILEKNVGKPLIQDGVAVASRPDRNRYRSLFSNYDVNFYHYRSDSHPHYVYWNDVAKLIVALQLWRSEHDGELPAHLSDLENGYLQKIPVEPMEGQPFHLSTSGLTEAQYGSCNFIDFAEDLRQDRDLNQFKVPTSVAGIPFIWVNRYRDPNYKSHRKGMDYIEINSVGEFATKKGTAYVDTYLLLDIEKEWK